MSEQIYYRAWYYNPENYHVVKPAVKAWKLARRL